jgi:hypothetical protein
MAFPGQVGGLKRREEIGSQVGRRTLAQTSPDPGAALGFALSGLSLPSGAAVTRRYTRVTTCPAT